MSILILTALLLLPSIKSTSTLLTASLSTVPAFPVSDNNPNTSAAPCELDLSSEMFGGVEEACGRRAELDRGRCCPVLAAWLFAAHSRSALRLHPSASPTSPLMPETDSKRCADALQTALASRNITLPRPNATCDASLCFCGIHLHQISSLSCSPSLNLSASGDIHHLERDCRDASYAGCTRCLDSLYKLKGGGGGGSGGTGERVEMMMDRDCRLMGLTWLLGRNKTAYIPTVSAVLRAIFYSHKPPAKPHGCSLDTENMPLAVDSVQVQRAAAGGSSSAPRCATGLLLYFVLGLAVAV